MNKLFYYSIIAFSAILITSCANQQPPGGGEEDKKSPEVINTFPKNNTVNFRDNVITIEFDEYVDRRSFIDAFRISPQIKSGYELDWSGTSVDIILNKPLQTSNTDKTFLFVINSNLKDIHGNSISSPFTLAVSTGPVIDKASISGVVYNNRQKIITILAYNISGSETNYEPTSKIADYYTETDNKGNYTLTNLAFGKYRVIAVEDDDNNLFYTAERENYAVLDRDINLTDTIPVKNGNFNIKVLNIKPSEIDLSKFIADSVNMVYSSIPQNGSILPEGSVYLYFKNYKFDREEFAKRLTISDASDNRIKPVINWRNDSIVEVFAAENFQPARSYKISFNLPLTKETAYNYFLNFKTYSSNSYGDLKGVIRLPVGITGIPAVVVVLNSSASVNSEFQDYIVSVKDTVFEIKRVLQGEYRLFSYIDYNEDKVYDYGSPFPYRSSEPFYFYPSIIKIKAGWEVENIIIDYNK